MRTPFHLAGIITATVAGIASAQPIAPAESGVKIDKQIIDNGPTRTVRYFVTGGSPQLQALVRRVEWAENELAIIDQLQLLKLETVVLDRRLAAVRTAQLSGPFVPVRFISGYYGAGYGYGDGSSHLQRALSEQLAYQATPQAALQLIGFLEQLQIQLDAELKALPPQEKKAAEGAVEKLRPMLAVWQRMGRPVVKPGAGSGDPRTTMKPQSVAKSKPLPMRQPAPVPAKTSAARPQIQTPLNPLAIDQFARQQFAIVQLRLMQEQ